MNELEVKQQFAYALSAAMQPAAQDASCESALLDGMKEDALKIGKQFVDKTLDRARIYVDCRFGAGTPQAQSVWTDIATVVWECAFENLGALLRGDYGAFFSAVTQCVIAKLIGGGGDPPPGGQGYNPSEAPRCG